MKKIEPDKLKETLDAHALWARDAVGGSRADLSGVKTSEAVASTHDRTFFYHAGATVKPHEFCEDRWQECSGGIHFFITRIEAENYPS